LAFRAVERQLLYKLTSRLSLDRALSSMVKLICREMSRLGILIRRRVLVDTAIRELNRYLAEKRRLGRWRRESSGYAFTRWIRTSGDPDPVRRRGRVSERLSQPRRRGLAGRGVLIPAERTGISDMDIGKVLGELREELETLNAAIASLERLQSAPPGGARRRREPARAAPGKHAVRAVTDTRGPK
jgi:hypothetical protein